MLFKLNGQVGPRVVVPLHAATKMWVSIFSLQLFLSLRLSFLRRTMSLPRQSDCSENSFIMSTVNTAALWDAGRDMKQNSVTLLHSFTSSHFNNHEHWLLRLGWKEEGEDRWENREKGSAALPLSTASFGWHWSSREPKWLTQLWPSVLVLPETTVKKEAEPSWRGVRPKVEYYS